jgi:hypothetical protein
MMVKCHVLQKHQFVGARFAENEEMRKAVFRQHSKDVSVVSKINSPQLFRSFSTVEPGPELTGSWPRQKVARGGGT